MIFVLVRVEFGLSRRRRLRPDIRKLILRRTSGQPMTARCFGEENPLFLLLLPSKRVFPVTSSRRLDPTDRKPNASRVLANLVRRTLCAPPRARAGTRPSFPNDYRGYVQYRSSRDRARACVYLCDLIADLYGDLPRGNRATLPDSTHLTVTSAPPFCTFKYRRSMCMYLYVRRQRSPFFMRLFIVHNNMACIYTYRVTSTVHAVCTAFSKKHYNSLHFEGNTKTA